MIDIEHRSSTSPYIARVWRAHARDVETMTSVANSMWELVVWNEGAQLLSTVRGPETHASIASVPQDSRSAGILFAHGVHLPHLPVSGLVDAQTPPRPITAGMLELAGNAWPLPGYDTAEHFVQQLAGAGVIARDPVVAEVLDGGTPRVSARTVQRRMAATTGLSMSLIRQIARAREAALRLVEGTSILEVVHGLGFYDQPHLSHALTRFIGRTAAQLAHEHLAQPMSMLYSPPELAERSWTGRPSSHGVAAPPPREAEAGR